jgi:hypothetical protein
MNAFSAAIDATFLDANMAADAVFRACGSMTDVPCRVIQVMPDSVSDYGSAAIVSDTMRIDVRVSEVPAPTEGARFTIDGEIFEVQGAPQRDRLRLAWRIELVPLERDDA